MLYEEILSIVVDEEKTHPQLLYSKNKVEIILIFIRFLN